MAQRTHEDRAGEFRLALPDGDWTPSVVDDSESFLAVAFDSPNRDLRLLVQRFRKPDLVLRSVGEFEQILDGVILGLEEALRPMKILERRVDPRVGAIVADLVLRGRPAGVDVMQRRRLIAPGPVPPAAVFLLTGSCAAERFLVHRRSIEEAFESFAYFGPTGRS